MSTSKGGGYIIWLFQEIGDTYMGLDPASKFDYFGIVIHGIPERPTKDEWLPQLVELQAVTHTSYTHVFNMLKHDLFRRYPPYYIVIDYSTEKTISEIFLRDFGKERVEPMSFGNQTKQQLKDDGLAILKQGYKFPRPENQKNKSQQMLLMTLIKQLHQEQMLFTPSGKTTFDHPTGEHNDLAVAWELSIHGCLKFIINSTDGPVAYSARNPQRRGWGIDDFDSAESDIKRFSPESTISNSHTYYP